MKFASLLVSVTFLILLSCNNECETVIERYSNGAKQVVRKYPNCGDSATYQQTYYFQNGQIGSRGFTENFIKNGLFESWNKDGTKTAEWSIKNGKENGLVQCWHDNGIKSKSVTLVDGKEHGLEKNWDTTGNLSSFGSYESGKQIGSWKYLDEDGSWKIRTYKNGLLNGPTSEYLVDSLGQVKLVEGQYKDGEEVGVWKWFNEDSTLTQTAIYQNGILSGEIKQYFKNGAIKLAGHLADGQYDGTIRHFDNSGKLIKETVYNNGALVSSKKMSN